MTIELDRERLIDLIAEHLSGTYHCTRVWSAWQVGTMSENDFEDVGESDTPSEIADAILALAKGEMCRHCDQMVADPCTLARYAEDCENGGRMTLEEFERDDHGYSGDCS
jgi:hypothetical protein